MPFVHIIFTLALLFNLSVFANGPMEFGKKKPSFETSDKKKKTKKNPLTDKPFAQLKASKEKAVKDKDLETAVKYLDAMRHVCTNHEMIKDILLEMADIYYTLGEFTKAERAYNEFVLLYPGASRCDYAHYRAVVCGWNLTLTIDRDQTKTQETLKLAQQFFTTHAKSSYLAQVQELANNCKEKLLLSDINIFNFHVHSRNFKAAQKRLENITSEHIPELPTHKPEVLELSIQLAQAQNNNEMALRAQLELGQSFPEHEITKRLVTDLPQIKTQLASIEQSKISDLPAEKSIIT